MAMAAKTVPPVKLKSIPPTQVISRLSQSRSKRSCMASWMWTACTGSYVQGGSEGIPTHMPPNQEPEPDRLAGHPGFRSQRKGESGLDSPPGVNELWKHGSLQQVPQST